jgi:hypothetical protein
VPRAELAVVLVRCKCMTGHSCVTCGSMTEDTHVEREGSAKHCAEMVVAPQVYDMSLVCVACGSRKE